MKLISCLTLFLATSLVHITPAQSAEYDSSLDWYKMPLDASKVKVAGKLPPNFYGHDPSRLYWGLDRVISVKRRYETTEQYKARQATDASKPLYGNVYLNSPITITTRPATTYDADTQMLSVVTRFFKADNGSSKAAEAVPWSNYGIRIMNAQDFKFAANGSSSTYHELKAVFKVAPERAAKMEDHLMVAISGRISAPLRLEAQSGFLVCLDVSSFTFYDQSSGYIYGRNSKIQQQN